MAITVTNKTHKPLSIALARGRVLHLGPGKSGAIAKNDVEHPAVKALVDAGAIEIVQGPSDGGYGSPPRGGTRRPRR
jgi:hypothetical protein